MLAHTDQQHHQSTWRDVLATEKSASYFKDLLTFVERERSAGKVIYPPNAEVFNAFHLTPFAEVKVVILGQDPYHGPHQAHGLCFSVRPPTPPPPSRLNIYKELHDDVGAPIPAHGSLESWARQGVLLLNAILTVEAEKPGSHANRGWERFTDRVIQELNERHSHLVFMKWGSHAQRKASHVDRRKHLVLEAPHPSPLSAYRGFFGCRHFSQANAYLRQHGIPEVQWQLDLLAPSHRHSVVPA
jgi:uracil-DNA glycosylase